QAAHRADARAGAEYRVTREVGKPWAGRAKVGMTQEQFAKHFFCRCAVSSMQSGQSTTEAPLRKRSPSTHSSSKSASEGGCTANASNRAGGAAPQAPHIR